MTTHEVEEMLGITKQSLIYYEKEGLIHPKRNENNYRNYMQKDINILKTILLLRSMEVSIDDIKLIFNNKLSIREAPESKKEFISNSKKKLEDIDKKINDYMKRRRVKVSFDNQTLDQWKGYDTLYLNDDHIKYNEVIVPLSQIQQINISMYSSMSVGHAGVGAYGIGGVFFQYFIDLDIVTLNDTYSYSILNNKLVVDMFDYILKNNITVYDPLHLIELYHEKHDPVALNNYINNHFKDWAKKYHLDNPRDNFAYYSEVYQNKEKNEKKDIFGLKILKKALKKKY